MGFFIVHLQGEAGIDMDAQSRIPQTDLQGIRLQIDQIDEQILALLQERARLALEAQQVKTESGLPPSDSLREETILRRLVERSSGTLPAEAVRGIFREIISCCKKVQGTAGPEATGF